MSPDLNPLWIYLQSTPLLGLAVTLLAYQAAMAISAWLGGHTLANPMLIAIGLIVCLLLVTGTPYHVYFQGAQYVQFLLGPATVALAVPMYANLRQIRRSARAPPQGARRGRLRGRGDRPPDVLRGLPGLGRTRVERHLGQ